MPVLPDLRHEAFAQARAKGALLEDAYEDAGFAPGHGHASRLAGQRPVAERIAELRAERSDLIEANPQAVVAALLRIAKSSEALTSPAGIKEARLTLLEAPRLAAAISNERARARPSC
ncbi:MAG: hypothetical protein M3Y22_00420 [Pseudomonadota bacterium]|nr:hypothetical protein [Pseudomonadota bacterium]